MVPTVVLCQTTTSELVPLILHPPTFYHKNQFSFCFIPALLLYIRSMDVLPNRMWPLHEAGPAKGWKLMCTHLDNINTKHENADLSQNTLR